MSERAKVFARAAAMSGGRDVLHIYLDGLVAVVGADEARTTRLRDLIRQQHPAAEFGQQGDVSAFVVPMDVDVTPVEHLPPTLCVATTAYHDHRQQDAATIDEGAALLSRVAYGG